MPSSNSSPPEKFSWLARWRSICFALQGARTLVQTQHNARLHLVATFLALGLGWALRISNGEWLAILLCIASVWSSEALNTALEFLADELSLERRERIKHAKDIAAFAVLLCAGVSLLVGCLVFLPKLADWLL